MNFSRIAHASSLLLAFTLSTSFASAQSLDALRAGCGDDVKRLCAGVQPGGGRVIACLKQNKDSLSDGCRQAAGLPPKSSSAPMADSAPAPAPAIDNSAEPQPKAGRGVATSAAKNTAANEPTDVAGEKFVRRSIPDTAHGNMIAVTVHLPERWKLDSKLDWHYDWIENPLVFSARAVNPDNAEAWFSYPELHMESIEVAPQYRQYLRGKQSQPGERTAMGAITMPVQPPAQALATFIKQTRPNAANLKWIGQQSLPGLAKALGMDSTPNQQGYAIKVGYDLNGKPVEEAFFGVYYLSQSGNQAKSVGQTSMGANMIKQTNWGYRALQSFRAPAGTLDKRMSVFCLIAKSLKNNPQWSKLARSVDDQLVADFNKKLQQGYDQIRASQAAMAQMQQQQASFQKTVDKFDAGLRGPGFDDSWLRTSGGGGSGGSGGTRSGFNQADDNIRGVDTVNDPSTGGTKQLSNAGQYHFTDGFGSYRTTDDPNYTPEKAGEVGSWTPMTPAD